MLSWAKHERELTSNVNITLMDLRIEYPRSLRETLGGYLHLARMIDKCRAKLAGTLGEYIFPCPLDQRFLEFVGISEDVFLQAVESRTDQEILAWVQTTAFSHTPREIEDWNHAFLTRGPDTEEKREYFNNTRDAIDSTRTDITSWADLLDLDEKRSVPIRIRL